MEQNDFNISTVNWDSVKSGINNCVNKIRAQDGYDKNIFQVIDNKTKETLSQEAKESYELIEHFRNQEDQILKLNKEIYKDCLSKRLGDGLFLCANKRFNSFDKDMAQITADAFRRSSNNSKHFFSKEFKDIFCKRRLDFNQTYDSEETVNGLKELLHMIQEQSDQYLEQDLKIAAYHANTFIEIIKNLISEHESGEQL